MGTETPKTQDSSGDTDSNTDSENSSSESSGSDWECLSSKKNTTRKPHFSVTSCDTGLKLKIAAIPRKITKTPPQTTPVKKKKDTSEKVKCSVKNKKELSDSSSSSCSKCSSGSSSEDDLPLSKTISKGYQSHSKSSKPALVKNDSDNEGLCDKDSSKDDSKDKQSVNKTVVKKTKSDDSQTQDVTRRRGRPQAKFASSVAESGPCNSSSSSSSSSTSSSTSSSSASSSSSDSDSADAAGGSAHASADDSSAALVAACQLQFIDDADLAELFPEQTSSAPAQQTNFTSFPEHNASPQNDDKSIDNGDGSSSEMEIAPQLLTAAIQRATADSSGSENECSNQGTANPTTTHYASSLLQQFVAQTQLLSSTAPMTPMSSTTQPIPCGLSSNTIDGVGSISDCVLGQINNLPDITTNFLSNQNLSPQQTEELTQINKELEDISCVTDSVGISIPNPPSLDDCVDNNDFMSLDITQAGSELGSASDLLKSSPLTIASSDIIIPISQIDSQKLDTISTNSVESQEDLKNVVVESRRKRGRPRKVRETDMVCKNTESQRERKNIANVINEFHNNNDPPNVSPDSGILSNHNSPTHSPMRRHDDSAHKSRASRNIQHKQNTAHDRRAMRSKSKTRNKAHNRSDSSDCDYQKRRIENDIKQIKTEAPSPVPLKQEQNKYEKVKKNDQKLDIAALDRMLYATDRVLYPPRKKVSRKPQLKAKTTKTTTPKSVKEKSQYDSGDTDDDSLPSNRSVLSSVYAKRKELNSKLAASLSKKCNKSFTNSWRDNQSENEAATEIPLDPTWKEVDLNPKYKDILSGYKSDYEFKPYKSCSRLIESGYKSDYGCRSGYKSDYYRSGYKSDHKSGYKTDKSGYKTDYSCKSNRRRTRKLKKTRSVRDRSYYKNQKHFVSDQEILKLANQTFSSLTLGHSSSDSECDTYLRNPNASPKYVSVVTKYPLVSKYNFGFSKISKKHILRPNSSDPFAPGPVFSGLQKPVTTCNIFKVGINNNTLLKSPLKTGGSGKPLPSLKHSFNHKFGASPIFTTNKVPKKENESSPRTFTGVLSPKTKKHARSPLVSKKDTCSKQIVNIFEKAKNSYVPNKLLMRNIFLNVKKPHMKLSFHTRKHRRTVVLAPPKINLQPAERPSRITIKTENKHHRHRSKRRHRSRSASRCRETKPVDTIDQKFSQDMESLVTNFIKLCQIAPKLITNATQSQSKTIEKPISEPPPTKVFKRGSKKRKTTDNQEIATPTSKRRHKKQLSESQNKGGKDTNEHKLPLKKRHYHINSTNNPLSLSLDTSEFDENAKVDRSPEKFLCTESNCLGDLQNTSSESPKPKTGTKKGHDHIKNSNLTTSTITDTSTKSSKYEAVSKSIEISETGTNKTSVSSSYTDDLSKKSATSEQSELSKKIYETPEKLKAIHKMGHDLEKALPKSKEDAKSEVTKTSNHRTMSPRNNEAKMSPLRPSATIVTPKKRHRLEAEKVISTSTLDQVVQSLTKKLSEDKCTSPITTKDLDLIKEDSKSECDKSEYEIGSEIVPKTENADPLKNMSVRTLYKSSIPPAQKSEIMTRKKNRLEGLTSNLVSKIAPSAATKVLDTLLNNNIRKSIESRIMEKEKTTGDSPNKSSDDKPKPKEISQISTRATVIKSPVSKSKVLESKKQRAMDIEEEHKLIINVDKPTGIFEPSIDLEDQIPKSSICISSILSDSKLKSKCDEDADSKPTSFLDLESDLPLSLMSDTPDSILNRPKRGESIASVISDKIMESVGGPHLRQTKRNSNSESDVIDKKKKRTASGLIRESKLVLPPKILIPKVPAEKLPIASDVAKKINNVTEKKSVKEPVEGTTTEQKKKTRRRKAFNRTGFPSVKKKKKKVEPINIQNKSSDTVAASDIDENSAFERVPKDGETTTTFLERTSNRKPELKVLLNKDECPKQGRLTVVALEKLQGKDSSNKNNTSTNTNEKNNTTSILRAPALQLRHNKDEKDSKVHVNKWEVLSETDSIPSLASSIGNDPEDSIPLSLLNVNADQPTSKLDSYDRLKRKTRACSPCHEMENIFSKKKSLDRQKVSLRPKSSLAILYPSERRQTRSTDNVTDELKAKKTKTSDAKVEKMSKPASIVARRKSRSYQVNKKIPEAQSSSRESSLDTVVSRKMRSISREPSLDPHHKDHDENEPLPLNEKEIDFEKSIDNLSKTIICKKRAASSRDQSPASSIDPKERPSSLKRNPRLRKKFLVAGLFSDYYKEDPKPEGKGKNLVTQTEFPPGLLAPPPYCERWVRRRLQHFSLPYDIWWQHHYNQPVPSWNYKKIRSNVYYDVKPSTDECESVACNCTPSSGCPEDCINRLVYSECSPQLCPCGDRCKNQRIQRHEWAPGLEKFMTDHKGWGVKTKQTIKSCDFILEYVGEVVSDKEFKERMATRYARDTHHYCLHLDGGLVIDGHRMGGDGRFVNHSCSPNCEMQKWTSNGTFRMALFALRDIEPGEELTYDYNFSLFNPAVGQPCKCDTDDCRGVIGGKSQRITKPLKTQSLTPLNPSVQNAPRVGRPRKSGKCNKKSEQQNIEGEEIKNMTILKYQQHLNKLWQEPQMKPLTVKERNIVKDRRMFLFRNLEKVRRMKDRISIAMTPLVPEPVTPVIPSSPVITNVNPLAVPDAMNPALFLNRLQAIRTPKEERPKCIVTDDTELSKQERLAIVFRALYQAVVSVLDEKNTPIAAPLLKRKSNKDTTSIPDLNTIDTNIKNNQYDSVGVFDSEMNSVFTYIIREHGRMSSLGAVALQLKKTYNFAKSDVADVLTKILGPEESLPNGFLQKNKPEDIIMCICSLHVEEGLMVQCGASGCGVWQHARCMRVADTGAAHYCHQCRQRPVDREIPLDDYTEDGHQFYLSLMRGNLQVRQGDTVYVLRDIPIDEKHPDVSQKNGNEVESPKTKRFDRKKVKNLGKKEEGTQSKNAEVRKHTYQTIGELPVSELDIFRVERLWKHKDTQERYVYGHHYLRPHETFHEPTRKFFPNEVMRVPLYEAVPIELVMSQCWVMDLNTYCKGRPVGASEEHVYICELRVDRTARLFTKISRPKYPICTKTYAFDHFPQRLKITRTYAPHEVLPEYLKGRAKNNITITEKETKTKPVSNKEVKKKLPTIQNVHEDVKMSRERQKERVNAIARRLLAQGNSRGKVDASYLLDSRRRKRIS